MYKLFKPAVIDLDLKNHISVIDGDYLSQKVVWSINQSLANICEAYISYIKLHFNENSVIVFDG